VWDRPRADGRFTKLHFVDSPVEQMFGTDLPDIGIVYLGTGVSDEKKFIKVGKVFLTAFLNNHSYTTAARRQSGEYWKLEPLELFKYRYHSAYTNSRSGLPAIRCDTFLAGVWSFLVLDGEADARKAVANAIPRTLRTDPRRNLRTPNSLEGIYVRDEAFLTACQAAHGAFVKAYEDIRMPAAYAN